MGHYERFTSLSLGRASNFTTGQVYLRVIENERRGQYLGKTVQVVPHITDEIKRRIHLAAEDGELLVGEIGGTVGDIESLPFLEAIRQFSRDVGSENVLFVHLVLVPYLEAAGELKSKPAQHSLRELRSIGLAPDLMIARSDRTIDASILDKMSLFSNLPREHIFSCIDSDSIYKVPLDFHRQGLDETITSLLGMWTAAPKVEDLEKVAHNFDHPLRSVKIGIVGKYTELIESYKSLDEALKHAATYNQLRLEPIYIDAEELHASERRRELLGQVQGILVPGGFGQRGMEGKIVAIRYAREERVPYLGICLGMQLAIIEFARHVAGVEEATGQEFSESGQWVVHYMPGQGKETPKGGSMRLGAYACELYEGTLAHRIYGEADGKIRERHRHRMEVNNAYLDDFKKEGPGGLRGQPRIGPGGSDRTGKPPLLCGLPVSPRI